MSCSLTILPTKCQHEHPEIFQCYQYVHESLSFSLITFRESIMLIFSHPNLLLRTICMECCWGWVSFKNISLAYNARKWAFMLKQGGIWSLSRGVEWRVITLTRGLFPYPSHSLPPRGMVKKLKPGRGLRAQTLTNSALGIKQDFLVSPSHCQYALPGPVWLNHGS